MARYHILADFMGSQDGRFTEPFKAGTDADLSDYLASCAPAGSIRRVEEVALAAPVAASPAPTSAKRKQKAS